MKFVFSLKQWLKRKFVFNDISSWHNAFVAFVPLNTFHVIFLYHMTGAWSIFRKFGANFTCKKERTTIIITYNSIISVFTMINHFLEKRINDPKLASICFQLKRTVNVTAWNYLSLFHESHIFFYYSTSFI